MYVFKKNIRLKKYTLYTVYSSPAQQQVSSKAQETPPPVHIIDNSSITQLIGSMPTYNFRLMIILLRIRCFT